VIGYSESRRGDEMPVIASRFAMAFMLSVTMSMYPYTSTARDEKTVQSSGLKASKGKISLVSQGTSKELAIQLILENITENRIYLFIIGDQRASLSDGKSLKLREVIGMPLCGLLYSPDVATKRCIEEHGMDINYYSYIDAGETSDISLRYTFDHVDSGFNPSGSLSFRTIMVSRVARAPLNSLEAGADSKGITDPKVIILNFPLIPFNSIEN